MVNKLKKVFRNEKGFTLVELLAVIVILGIIIAIAVPAIGSIIDKAETDASESQKELIIDAAKLADANNEFTGATENVMTVEELVSAGYLEDSDDSDFPSGSVTKSGNKFTYSD
ncbi:prepilin-type N-terminal cleavage/methylation domain-containing protein [Paraliobacillus salinarum]|uniref:prepilin-type N-terminal cleavage/methylation domain-containing protein n=1 Tax=Paraliobacillus salinarum TaxID=1158996 RepID=UPI0015F7609E|nr:prepilin-type N-terminal cleavage/methylation domain-containing protein [Paraliobacillus salinarum]